jgi:hypothetical protein
VMAAEEQVATRSQYNLYIRLRTTTVTPVGSSQRAWLGECGHWTPPLLWPLLCTGGCV